MLLVRRHALVVAISFGLLPSPSLAGGPCTVTSENEVGVMRVRSGLTDYKAHFQAEPSVCPKNPGRCPWRKKAYLVSGDLVLATSEVRGFRCVSYRAADGKVTSGFLPSDALQFVPEEELEVPLDAVFLSGKWESEDGTIDFAPAGANGIKAEGYASWNSGLPGGINTGTFAGTAVPDGATITYVEGEGEVLCQITMVRYGPYLRVSDNGSCGGLNVSFSGLYAKVSTGKSAEHSHTGKFGNP
jgi:hypothetical protein